MKSQHHSLLQAPKYKRWVKQRDVALEDLHTLAQRQSSDVLRKVLTGVMHASKSFYHSAHHAAHSPGQMHGHSPIDSFEQHLKPIFQEGIHALVHILLTMRVRSYALAKASEAEIIAQLMVKKTITAKIHKSDIDRIKSKKAFAGGAVIHRVTLYMDRLRRKIVSMAQASALNAPDVESFLIDVRAAFPKKRVVKRPKRILKPKLMEATAAESLPDFAQDQIDPETWDDALRAYKEEFVPQWRSPDSMVGIPTDDGALEMYSWEFERDLTNEFVSSVRDGQVEAAEDNGITDFVWIAVVDDKIDDCCLWRDGLLTSEIQDQLDDHTDEDSDIDGDPLTPPVHFNCRCTLAPATENIPDKPDDGAKEFDEWLGAS